MPAADTGIDVDALTPVVRTALGSAQAKIVEWSTQPILGGLDRASTVHRVSGTARVRAQREAWSVVLKIVRPSPGQTEPTSPYFWLREARAYASGLLDPLASRLVAPRCLAVDEGEAEVRLWLEDVDGVSGAGWTLNQTLAAIRRFGAFHGSYLASRPLPTDVWLVRSLRRRQAEEAAPGIARLAAMTGHPLVQAGWPGDVYEQVLRFWADDLPRFLDALDGLPHTLQHGDANGLNLFARQTAAGDETVAVDWAWLGIAAVGEDLAVLWNWFGATMGAAVIEKLLTSYVAGLRDAGWNGDERLVRTGWALTVAVRYLAHPLMLACLDESQRRHFELQRGMPLEQFMGVLSSVVWRALAPAAEARELLGR
jgi:hypothetical protein